METTVHGFMHQLVWHSKIFSRSPMPYSQEDIHSTKLLKIHLYAIIAYEFCSSMPSWHVRFGLVCNIPCTSSNIITLSLSGIKLARCTAACRCVILSECNTVVQMNTLTSYKCSKDIRDLFTFIQALSMLNLR